MQSISDQNDTDQMDVFLLTSYPHWDSRSQKENQMPTQQPQNTVKSQYATKTAIHGKTHDSLDAEVMLRQRNSAHSIREQCKMVHTRVNYGQKPSKHAMMRVSDFQKTFYVKSSHASGGVAVVPSVPRTTHLQHSEQYVKSSHASDEVVVVPSVPRTNNLQHSEQREQHRYPQYHSPSEALPRGRERECSEGYTRPGSGCVRAGRPASRGEGERGRIRPFSAMIAPDTSAPRIRPLWM